MVSEQYFVFLLMHSRTLHLYRYRLMQLHPILTHLEIEQQITSPIELSISGLPGLINVRSISKFGLSQIVATFNDETDI